uniref:Minor capsid protein P11 C-terminal conserved region domain-containing protein n=1 Tax=viral metagenome TaxID=1070528 RepID=A0A6C0BRX2_9ZZZZ
MKEKMFEDKIIILIGFGLAIFFIGYLLSKGSKSKCEIIDTLDATEGDDEYEYDDQDISAPSQQPTGPTPTQSSQCDTYARVGDSSSITANGAQMSDPSELLPNDKNTKFAKMNPTEANPNLLKAAWNSGIDTVAGTLRNANLQLRSEIPNPTNNVSVWNQTTIEPDLMRVPLELGCSN